MGRICSICNHDLVDEINAHLIKGDLTFTDIATQYGVSIYAIERHKANHLDKIIKKIRSEREDKIRDEYLSNLEALNLIIQRLPEVLSENNPSINQILDAIRERASLLGERFGQPEIRIIWGKGADESSQADAISEPQLDQIEELPLPIQLKKPDDDE